MHKQTYHVFWDSKVCQAYILKWLEVDKQVLERWLNREKGYTVQFEVVEQETVVSIHEDSIGSK